MRHGIAFTMLAGLLAIQAVAIYYRPDQPHPAPTTIPHDYHEEPLILENGARCVIIRWSEHSTVSLGVACE